MADTSREIPIAQRGRRAAAAAIGLLIPLLLVWSALPRLREGLAIENSLAAVNAAMVGPKLPAAEFRAAAQRLSAIDPGNGSGLILRAELIADSAEGHRDALMQARHSAVD